MLIPAVAEEAVTGDWYLHIMKMDGEEHDAAALGYALHLVLNDDNTISGDQEGTWTQEGDHYVLTIENAPANATLADGLLLVEADADMLMTFSREIVEKNTVGEVDPAAPAEAFEGVWSCLYVDSDGIAINVRDNLETMGFTELPCLKIENSALSVTGLEAMLVAFTDLKAAYADGTLNAELVVIESAPHLPMKLQMLQDGLLKLSIMTSEDDPIIIYFEKAAAEEPAA